MKHYYARYCKYGVTTISKEEYILSYENKACRDAMVLLYPEQYEPLKAKSKVVRRHLNRQLSTGESKHNPHLDLV
jgi:Fe-S cluster assembly ATPase SufC